MMKRNTNMTRIASVNAVAGGRRRLDGREPDESRCVQGEMNFPCNDVLLTH